MVDRIVGLFFLITLSCFAQKKDRGGERMEPVVPEHLIPASPVLPVAEALKSFELAQGFVIEPVAAEPLIQEPVCLDFDAAGRMWVCEMKGYMPDVDGKGESVPQGSIVILEDTNGDGEIDKRSVFLDQIQLPRAVAVFGDGILSIDEKQLCWIPRKGDLPAGQPQVLDARIGGIGNVEHKPNGLLPNLDNRYYIAKSDKRLHRTAHGWEFEPTSFRGQWGIARDDFGRLYHNNNSTLLFGDFLAPNLLQGNPGVKMKSRDSKQLGTNLVWPIRVTPGVNRGYEAKAHGFGHDVLDPKTYKLLSATSAAGMTIYRGTNFPRGWYGTAFSTESAANLVKATQITRGDDGSLDGSHPLGEREFLASTDERFRPVNAYTAPDGSLYIIDMYHGIIQHRTYMTPYLREQSLSRGLESPAFGHGRIYRIRSKSGKLETLTNIGALHGLDLVKVLMHPNAWQREMAQRVLVERKDPATVPFLVTLAGAGSAVARIHAIWTLEGMGALEPAHLVAPIRSEDAELQASALWAATRLDPEELSKLGPVLLDVRPVTSAVTPYLARVLGPLGKPSAFRRLATLLQDFPAVPLLREAVVSGLAGHEQEFLDAEMKASKDQKLIAWLEQGSRHQPAEPIAKAAILTGVDAASFERGKTLFHGAAACFGCHGVDGAGVPNLGPPLDASEWVTGPPDRLIKILLHGMSGPVTVDGEIYNPAADMPGLVHNPEMTDQSVADIATYIRNEWTNHVASVPAAAVQRERNLGKARAGQPWTAEELVK